MKLNFLAIFCGVALGGGRIFYNNSLNDIKHTKQNIVVELSKIKKGLGVEADVKVINRNPFDIRNLSLKCSFFDEDKEKIDETTVYIVKKTLKSGEFLKEHRDLAFISNAESVSCEIMEFTK